MRQQIKERSDDPLGYRHRTQMPVPLALWEAGSYLRVVAQSIEYSQHWWLVDLDVYIRRTEGVIVMLRYRATFGYDVTLQRDK